MNPKHPLGGFLHALTISLLVLAGTAGAIPVITTADNGLTTPSNNPDELAYSSFVSTTDLLNGIVGTGGSWNANGSSPAGLNDGVHGGDSNVSVPVALSGAAWAKDGSNVSFRDFFLGTGANGLGYDIAEIQSITAWQGGGFQNQKYEVLVSTVGSSSFTLLTTVDFQPSTSTAANTNQGGSTKVNVTDTTGILASGIDALRFNVLDTVGNAAGGTVFREIDVFGTPTSPADTAPVISSLSPLDGAVAVPANANLVANFSENIVIGTGDIIIKNLDAPSQISIPVGDPQVSVSGAILTINPTANLAPGANYAIQIDATAIDDTTGNSFAGIGNDTTWNFTTVALDSTAPTVATLNPADDSTNVSSVTNLVATFSENIALGSGDITIKNLDAPSSTAIPVGDSQVSVSGAVLTINPTVNLAANTNYAIQIAATAITDIAGNPFAGIANDITWNFSTGATPAEQFSTTQHTFAADVSASDLLHGLTPVTTGWNTTNQASPLELTDGIHGGAYQALPGDWVQGAWTTVGATATYHLGLGPGGAGYDINSVQSIADWVSVGFGNQAWTIEVKPVGGNYSTLATVNYQPLGTGVGGATKVTLTHPSGVLATGIEFIKVTANQVNGGANAGSFVWRELDVFGVPTDDETQPNILSLNPADGATGASLSGNLVATFSETIALGSGDIIIRNLDTVSDTVITLPDARVSVSGAALTINPDTDLAAGTHYAILIGTTVVDDLSGNSFVGIGDDITWDFTTGVPDLTAPTLVTLSPSDNSTNVTLASNLVVTFSENIALGSGSITIKNLDTLSDTVISLPDARVSVSGTVLTINPSSNFATTTDYAVQITAGAITDLSGNPFSGITNDTTWNFATASTPLRIMCLGDSITVGYTDNPNWTYHPFMFGYRSGLYTRLTNAGYNFQFVGASTEPWTGISGDPTHGGTYTPALDLRTFGQDGHRGYGGASIWSNVNSWIAADDPDVILLLIGINGIGSGSPAALNTLVNSIVTTAPDVHLIVAQITPRSTFNQSLFNYNVYIRDTLVPTYAGNGHKVTTVDLYSLFLTDPDNYSSAIEAGVLSNNINHPDNPHYDMMAQEWFEGIEALGLGPNTFTNWISAPAFGIAPGQQGLNQDPDGDGTENGVENFFGTDPGKSSSGLVGGTKSGNTFTFSHPINATPAANLTAIYRWSKDLSTFTTNGQAFEGTTVTFTPGTPVAGFVTLTATVTGTAIDKLFVDVKVEE